jgi:hypothetical protein
MSMKRIQAFERLNYSNDCSPPALTGRDPQRQRCRARNKRDNRACNRRNKRQQRAAYNDYGTKNSVSDAPLSFRCSVKESTALAAPSSRKLKPVIAHARYDSAFGNIIQRL